MIDERISKPKIRLWCTYIIQDDSKPNIIKKLYLLYICVNHF